MIDGTEKGKYTRHARELPNDLAWERFYPLRDKGKLSNVDIVKELFDWGLYDNMYVALIRVPEEYPNPDAEEYVDLYEPEDALNIIAGWEGLGEALKILLKDTGYKIIDSEGNEI